MKGGQTPLSWTSGRVANATRQLTGKPTMYEHHYHRNGHPAAMHVSSSRVHPAHVVASPLSANLASVKPGTSWRVDFSTFTNYPTTGFAKTGQRPREANS